MTNSNDLLIEAKAAAEKQGHLNACCARCRAPMNEEQYKVERFTYGSCCILQVVLAVTTEQQKSSE